jgi:hypothetical protein
MGQGVGDRGCGSGKHNTLSGTRRGWEEVDVERKLDFNHAVVLEKGLCSGHMDDNGGGGGSGMGRGAPGVDYGLGMGS